MIDALLGELVSAGSTELLLTAGEHLVEKVKYSHDIKKLFVETGESLIDSNPQAERLFEDMALIFSKENMTILANELKDDSGYTIKKRLIDSIVSLMDSYDIPREYALLYANKYLYMLLNQLPEIVPQQYDRYFQSEWREEQNAALAEIKQKIDKVNEELNLYKGKSISIESADQLDIRIRRQTNNPRIGIEFFDIDDDNFKDAFEERINNEIIRVRAKCREEAIYCIVNELWRNDEKRAIFIVNSLEDWDKLAQTASIDNIYIPWFWAEEICAIKDNTNIFIYTDGMPSFSDDEIILRPRTFQTISNALARSGLDINEANTLVSETHGLYIQMKRKIFNGQYLRNPEWIEKLPENIKKTGLLVGQWTDLEGDQEVVAALSGLKYEEFIDCIMPFTKGEDPFIYVIKRNDNREFYLSSVENTWEFMDIDSDDNIWNTFKSLFIDVLNESEKLFAYTPHERMAAQIKGERLFWSSTLRTGMVRSLIMKSFYKNDIKFQESLDELINHLLGHIKTNEQWKYISNFFVDLCEISPKAVINRLFSEFKEPTGLWELFDSQTSDFIWGKNYYVDILFGVDEFLVQDEYAAKGYEWLLMLDNKSYEYKGNSPKDTIEKVLCSWCNYSTFKTVGEKVLAAQKALDIDRNAWNLIFEALPSGNKYILGEIHKPKYRSHIETTAITRRELNRVTEEYVLLLINNADFIPERWGDLLGIADELPDSLFEKIFSNVLFQASQMSDSEQIKLKKLIRQLIYKHRFFASASWAMGEEKLIRYEELLDGISINIPEYEYTYLFDSDRDTILLNPVPYDVNDEKKLNEETAEKILHDKITEFKERGLNLSVLAESCLSDTNSNLGKYWAKYEDENDFNQHDFEVLFAAQEKKQMALDYCYAMSLKDRCVFEKVLGRKDELNYDDDFIVGLYTIQAKVTNDIPAIDLADESIKKLFWKNRRFSISNNFEWALNECRKYGTTSSYIELLYNAYRNCGFNSELLYNYLVDIYNMPVDTHIANVGYYLAELLKPIQKEFSADSEKSKEIARIEMNFFGILDWGNLVCFQNEIKRTPDIYAEIASIIFKRDDAEVLEERTEEQKKFVNAVYHLFDKAHFCPAEKNGVVDIHDLHKWICDFKKILVINHQINLFGFLLGRLWVYSPVDSDNYYPCEAVRVAFEEYADEDMVLEYKISLFNQRGVFTPSAGREEQTIAEKYKDTAEHLKIKFPKLAEIFYSMYRRYMAESAEERNRAENGQF